MHTRAYIVALRWLYLDPTCLTNWLSITKNLLERFQDVQIIISWVVVSHICLMFILDSSLFGEMIQLDEYFSDGLKPPASLLMFLDCTLLSGCGPSFPINWDTMRYYLYLGWWFRNPDLHAVENPLHCSWISQLLSVNQILSGKLT